MGTMRWARALTPSSAISAGDGHVYLIEDGMRLVARNQSDGTVDWMATVPGASVQAPVLAGSLVVVAGASGITAYRAVGGAMAWTSTVRATAVRSINTFRGGCAGLVMEGGPIETTMAAAMGSGTLVVTDAMGGITVLGLADGAMRWHGAVSGATGTLHDPVLVGDTVYVLDGDGLISLRAM